MAATSVAFVLVLGVQGKRHDHGSLLFDDPIALETFSPHLVRLVCSTQVRKACTEAMVEMSKAVGAEVGFRRQGQGCCRVDGLN